MSKEKYDFLDNLSLKDLRKITKEIGIESKNIGKNELISILKNGFKKYGLGEVNKSKKKDDEKDNQVKSKKGETKKSNKKEEERKSKKKDDNKKSTNKKEVKKEDEYIILERTGYQGKEGLVYTCKKKGGKKEYVMKKFKKTKSENNILKEAELLSRAAKAGLSPKVIDINTKEKWIVMDKLDKSLFDILKETGGVISKEYQKRMIEIFKKLDDLDISHGDPSALNFMEKDGQLYIIDFGFGKEMKKGDEKNIRVMPLGFILKVKDICGTKGFGELLKYISKEDKKSFGI